MEYLVALAILASQEMEPIVKILMNVLEEMMIVTEMQHASIMKDHLVAHASLASLEMEPIAKI